MNQFVIEKQTLKNFVIKKLYALKNMKQCCRKKVVEPFCNWKTV